MWQSKGRSGYGDSTIGGDYGSWDGISPNGKQYKNEATMETRDLSGADYWHLRKQSRPTEDIPAELHMLNGKANINVYGRLDEPKKSVSKVNIKDKILPQKRRVDSLTAQMVELEAEYKSGKMSITDYSLYRDIVSAKRDRAIVLLDRAMKVKPIRPETYEDEGVSSYVSSDHPSDNNGHGESYSPPVGGGFFAEVIDELSDSNSLKNILKKACVVCKTLVRWSQQAAAYYRTLKEV